MEIGLFSELEKNADAISAEKEKEPSGVFGKLLLAGGLVALIYWAGKPKKDKDKDKSEA